MAASNVKPAFSLKEEVGRWKIELVNFKKFEEVLTRKVLNARSAVALFSPIDC